MGHIGRILVSGVVCTAIIGAGAVVSGDPFGRADTVSPLAAQGVPPILEPIAPRSSTQEYSSPGSATPPPEGSEAGSSALRAPQTGGVDPFRSAQKAKRIAELQARRIAAEQAELARRVRQRQVAQGQVAAREESEAAAVASAAAAAASVAGTASGGGQSEATKGQTSDPPPVEDHSFSASAEHAKALAELAKRSAAKRGSSKTQFKGNPSLSRLARPSFWRGVWLRDPNGAEFPREITRWANMVLVVMKEQGIAKKHLVGILAQIQAESGGIPKAVNKSDSNEADGTPSKGLLQMIGHTYQANAKRGLESLQFQIHPYANVWSALNYVKRSYGLRKFRSWDKGDNGSY